jgi:hypothetical protein
VVGDERRHDALRERRPQVEGQMWQPHPVRDGAREADGMGRAAGGLRVVGGVAPQLERHGHRLAARAGHEQRGDGRIDAAAHRHQRAPRRRRKRPRAGHRRPERDVQGVGGELRRVQLSRREPAELRRDLPRADPRGVEHRRAAHELDHGRAGRDRRAAPRRLEAGGVHAVTGQRQVDAHEVAAGGAPGRAGERRRGHVAAPPGVLQMLPESLGVHDAECRSTCRASRAARP